MSKKPKDEAIVPDEHDTPPEHQTAAGHGDAAAPDSDVSPQRDRVNQSAEPDDTGEDRPEPTAQSETPQESDSPQEQEADINSLPNELAASRERALRLQAELENYRKRTQRVLEEERRYASLPLMRDLLPVVDNLRRAIDAAQQDESAAGLLEGVEIVADQLTSVLNQHRCEEIPAQGAQFDPNVHEAIAQLPSDDHEPGDVMEVTQVGYQLHDRVIRPAQVVVAAPKNDRADDSADGAG